MGFENLPKQELYCRVLEDSGINWATPLEVIAAAFEESRNRNVVPFNFVNDIRGINAYIALINSQDEKKVQKSRLFREKIFFCYDGKDYLHSREVSSALSSKFLRRVENPKQPSYYQVNPKIEERLDKLTRATKELLLPVGTGFCDRFGCNSDGKLLYR